MLALNLIFSRGLATTVLQYYDMDYPTYAICRNSKMVFVMLLSVVWLRKPYRCSDWILVLLTSLSVLSFRLASHDLWFSSANTMVLISYIDTVYDHRILSLTKATTYRMHTFYTEEALNIHFMD